MFHAVNKIQFYFFTNTLNEIINQNIIKFRNICIIYRPEKDISKNFTQITKIRSLCKKNKILFYIADNYQLVTRYKADGIFLSSSNKCFIKPMQTKNNFNIIGLAHNFFEYSIKTKQNCKEIMLSPIFYNKKYSNNKILGVIKFNLISIYWNAKLCALGGINLDNLKKLRICKVKSIAFVSLMNNSKIKKPIYLFSRWA
jgi:thiamine-phosphate pyrophosphorylase